MNREEQVLIELLKHFIHRTAPIVPKETDWDEVVYLASANSVMGIVSYMIVRYQLEEEEEILHAAKKCYERIYRRFEYLSRKTDELCAVLSGNGIDHLRLKGAAIRELYPIPQFRSFGDVDILIRKEDREKSRRLFHEMGFSEIAAWEPIFCYRRKYEFYEIHSELLEWEIPRKPQCGEFFRQPWENTQRRSETEYCFTPEYNFLYLLTHLAKHLNSEGAGIRMYMDLAVYLQHYGDAMDWDQIRNELAEMDLLEFGQTALYAVQEWFGVSCVLSDTEKSPDFMDRFAHRTLQGGIYGNQDKDSGTLDLGKEIRASGKTRRFSAVMKRVFPPARQIAPRYTYLKKRTWLLPVAWVHRIVINRDLFASRYSEIREILRADPEEAKEWSRLLRETGL